MILKKKIIIAITGASGSIYAKILVNNLIISEIRNQIDDVNIVLSSNAKDVWEHELGKFEEADIQFKIFGNNDFNAPFASGSAGFDTMIIIPCSMGMLGRIANGVSNDLISRAADVVLKERRKLILVTRETPLSLIHINSMKTITEAGGIICPATPSFYSNPQTINELVQTVVDRVISLVGIETNSYSWGGKN